MDALAIVLWATAAAGLLSMIIGLARPDVRRVALAGAAVLFLPIGIAGLLSIGAAFLLLSVLCLVGAARSPRGGGGDPSRQARR